MLGRAGFTPIDVHGVATLHRYAGAHGTLATLLRAGERILPADRRSTIVAAYRVVPERGVRRLAGACLRRSVLDLQEPALVSGPLDLQRGVLHVEVLAQHLCHPPAHQ